MYRPKKHVRLNSLPHAPRVSDVKSLSDEARKAKGCTVELPWRNKLTGVAYSLTMRLEVAGGEPIWTLYEGEGAESRVVWSSPFEDVDLLYDVLMLSIPEEVETEFNTRGANAPEPVSKGSSQSKESNYSGIPTRPPGLDQDTLLTGNEKVEVPKSTLSFYQSGLASENEFALLSDTPDVAKQKEEKKKDEKKKDAAAAENAPAAPGATAAAAAPAAPLPGQPQMPGAQQQLPYPPNLPYPVGYQYPAGYQYPQHYPQGYPQGYYPGYPPYGYPPGYGAMPGQQGMMESGVHQMQSGVHQMQSGVHQMQSGVNQTPQVPSAEPDKPRPNLRLGQFLVEAGLVPESTVDAALQLQELVRSGSLTTAQAAEAVRRAHIRGGAVDPKLIAAPVGPNDLKAVAPPLGQILVEAAIIRGPVIRSALKLQESIRSGAMSKEDALDALCLEVFGVGRKVQDTSGETTESTLALELLRKAQLVSDFDHETASKVRDKHGGQLVSILVKAGKLDQHTADGALKCNELIAQKKLEEGKAIIALHYCQRSRIDLDSALKELGWES